MAEYFVEIQKPEQVGAYLKKHPKLVLSPFDFSEKNISTIIENALSYNNSAEIYLDLPVFARSEDVTVIRGILKNTSDLAGIVANNLYAVQLGKELGIKTVLGQGLTVTNSQIPQILGAEEYVISPQLGKSDIFAPQKTIIFAYGYLKCMTIAADVGETTLTDKKNARFKIFKQTAAGKTYALYNSVRHDIIYEAAKIAGGLYLNMLGHSADEISEILERPFKPRAGCTKGNWKRGLL